MKVNKSFVSIMAIALVCGCGSQSESVFNKGTADMVANTADSDKIAISIVYDASGSMGDAAYNAQGQPERKSDIANRAMLNIGKQLDRYLSVNTNRLIALSIVLIKGGSAKLNSHAVITGSSSEFFTKWVNKFPGTGGGTPLGYAVDTAVKQNEVYPSISKRHVLVVTDGMNTSGPNSDYFINEHKKVNQSLGFHFVAFDIGAGTFKTSQDLGATVVEAFDEKQLTERLNFVLIEKILLERED